MTTSQLKLPYEDPDPERHVPSKLLPDWLRTPPLDPRIARVRQSLGDRVTAIRQTGGDFGRCTIIGCPNPATERHHTADRAIFGAWAEQAPVIPLCAPCHHFWTETVELFYRTKFARRSA